MQADLLSFAGEWGAALMLLLFFVSAVSLLPRPALCIVAGSAYGLYGIPLALIGSILGASVAYWLGLVAGRRYGHRLTRRWHLLDALRETIRISGWRIVLLCRFAPIAPSSLMSFMFGSTSTAFGPFLVATGLGILPGIALQVAAGAGLRAGLDGHLSTLQIVTFGMGLCAGLAALLLLGRKMRQVLASYQSDLTAEGRVR
ncbi:TVP38/TMEM64 family protein [Labrys sp. ZIDIC5]|uniref:TVP38/TMEM64 family protein n=1 Tax=Labrys sedimenti TaxID=3106036 RepID=UPI002ACA0709|nr:VTT domain-containing protein [Labrys sp. ZIDIC5]MDZ5451000.1 VTT domain-containing protein [Labrys sp. ZIDIC5]